ncbi:MAG: hypothetical protein QXT26_07295 [Thermoproteota archaeon]
MKNFFDKIERFDEELEELAERFEGELDGNLICLIPGKDELYGDYEG